MARSRGKRNNRLPPFVALLWEMLNSNAYRELPYASAKALPFFLGKFKGAYREPQRYLFEFHFSYSEAKRYGFSNSTFSKVIQELIRKGFVDPVDRGGLRSDGKGYNLFKLSRRWEKYGTIGFDLIEWRCFLPRLKLKATPKSETNSSKKGNRKALNDKNISQFGVVEGVLA